MSLKEPKVVNDLRQLTAAVFRMSRSLPKHLRPTVAGRIEEHLLDAWLGTRQFVLTPGHQKSGRTDHIRLALGSVEAVGCLLELCLELRAISDGTYGELIGSLEQVRRQLYGLQGKYGALAASF